MRRWRVVAFLVVALAALDVRSCDFPHKVEAPQAAGELST